MTLLPNLKMFLFVEINFGNHHPEWLLKTSEVFERNICGGVLLKLSHCLLSFTVILLMFLKLTILLNFIMIYEDFFLILLILVSPQPYLNLTLIYLGKEGEGRGVCITANGNILANGNLCFTVTKLQLKVINEKFCYLYSAWVNQIN